MSDFHKKTGVEYEVTYHLNALNLMSCVPQNPQWSHTPKPRSQPLSWWSRSWSPTNTVWKSHTFLHRSQKKSLFFLWHRYIETYWTSRMRAAQTKVLALASGLFGRSPVGIEIDVSDLEWTERKGLSFLFTSGRIALRWSMDQKSVPCPRIGLAQK